MINWFEIFGKIQVDNFGFEGGKHMQLTNKLSLFSTELHIF